MGNFIILETDIEQGKERNQAKISLKNKKLSTCFLLMFMGEGIWKLEGQKTREVRSMDAIHKIFVGMYG
jgi:hypothetical protein